MTDDIIHSYISTLGGSFWLGGQRVASNSINFGWNDRSPWSYTRWKSGEPNNFRGKEGCIELMDNEWNDSDCQNAKEFVCQQNTRY